MPIARLGAISLDSDDPVMLGRFYHELLDARITYESASLVALQAGDMVITVERVGNHQPPDWPDDKVPKQLHFDFLVDDLDTAERAALAIGALKADFQPSPDRWRVLLDPSGHPFCLTVPSSPA
jgi:catechol-2,3-dioxygenase